jgi:hypothetical protein
MPCHDMIPTTSVRCCFLELTSDRCRIATLNFFNNAHDALGIFDDKSNYMEDTELGEA